MSGRLPPVEEEIVAVEDSLAGRVSDQHNNQRRHDFQLQDHSPYCASIPTSSVTSVVATTVSTPHTLLNYLQMDHFGSSYLTNQQFNSAHRTTVALQQQTQPQQQQQQQQQYQHLTQEQSQLQRQPIVNESVFTQPVKVSSQVQVCVLLLNCNVVKYLTPLFLV